MLTSSSQYFRITSKALSVISGASKTTLVKTLPKKDAGLAGEVCSKAACISGAQMHHTASLATGSSTSDWHLGRRCSLSEAFFCYN